jgi:hypothetical protein
MPILALVNHTFQSWSIYRFTKSKIFVGFLLVTALASCGVGVTIAIEMWISSKYVPLQKKNNYELTPFHPHQALKTCGAAAHCRGQSCASMWYRRNHH